MITPDRVEVSTSDLEYLTHRGRDLKEAYGVLKATMDRQFPPNEPISRAMESVDLEFRMFESSLSKLKKEK